MRTMRRNRGARAPAYTGTHSKLRDRLQISEPNWGWMALALGLLTFLGATLIIGGYPLIPAILSVSFNSLYTAFRFSDPIGRFFNERISQYQDLKFFVKRASELAPNRTAIRMKASMMLTLESASLVSKAVSFVGVGSMLAVGFLTLLIGALPISLPALVGLSLVVSGGLFFASMFKTAAYGLKQSLLREPCLSDEGLKTQSAETPKSTTKINVEAEVALQKQVVNVMKQPAYNPEYTQTVPAWQQLAMSRQPAYNPASQPTAAKLMTAQGLYRAPQLSAAEYRETPSAPPSHLASSATPVACF